MAAEKKIVKARAGIPDVVGERTFAPLVDIYEQDDGTTIIVAELPGVQDEAVDISVDKGVLTIFADGTRKVPLENAAHTYIGFTSGEFFRAFALSDEVDRGAIDAHYEDGLLTVRLPRAEETKTRKIEIK